MSDPHLIVRPEGHEDVFDRFRISLRRGRLGSAYLFVGPDGIGKRTFAHYLAATLLCETAEPETLVACGHCPACQQVAASTHPDFDYVSKPADKFTIPVELLIGDKQNRMREGLCARIAMTPARGRRKIAVIDDADFLSQESANCLLKTLEEPPVGSLLILIGTSAQRQLPTIRSRCQIVTFRPLSFTLTERLILEQGLATSSQDVARIAQACHGSLTVARLLQSPDVWAFQQQLTTTWSGLDWKPMALVKVINEFVDGAGKEANVRRERLALVTEMAADFFRETLFAVVHSAGADSAYRHSAQQLASCWRYDTEALITCLDRCLYARQQIVANANLATLLECWIDDLWGVIHLGQASYFSSISGPTGDI